LTDPVPYPRINFVSRFKLYAGIAPLAFFAGVVSAPAGRREVSADATSPREQFDGNCANNFFPC
jgi:hypothetical protein